MAKELAGGEGQKRVRLSPAISLCQTLDKSREKLANTNIADWSNEDLQTATASVTAIRDAADAFLNSPGEGGSDTSGNGETPPSRELA